MVIYGKQACLYALERHSSKIERLYIAKRGILPQELFHQFHDKITFIEPRWAQAKAHGGNHQGILLEMSEPEPIESSELKEYGFVVLLDGLTDMGNIGAIVRSAYALGADAIVFGGLKNLQIDRVVRTSSGALLDMPFVVMPNVLSFCNECKQVGFDLIGAVMDGDDVGKAAFGPKRLLIMGNEAKGIQKRLASLLTQRLSIKMKHGFDSLNVSAAAAILIDRIGYDIR